MVSFGYGYYYCTSCESCKEAMHSPARLVVPAKAHGHVIWDSTMYSPEVKVRRTRKAEPLKGTTANTGLEDT